MGNEASSYAESPAGPPLQSQDSNSPWTVLRKDVEDGEVCEFSHQLEGNLRDDLCKTALEVKKRSALALRSISHASFAAPPDTKTP